MKKIVALFAAALVAGLFAAGCGPSQAVIDHCKTKENDQAGCEALAEKDGYKCKFTKSTAAGAKPTDGTCTPEKK